MIKIPRKIRKIFSLYNILILICAIFIIVALIMLFKPNIQLPKFSLGNNDGKISIVQSKIGETETITKDEAIKLAISQFKKLGEKALSKEDVTSLEIERNGELYYYICSPQNTLEIKIIGGEITRLNSVPVENL